MPSLIPGNGTLGTDDRWKASCATPPPEEEAVATTPSPSQVQSQCNTPERPRRAESAQSSSFTTPPPLRKWLGRVKDIVNTPSRKTEDELEDALNVVDNLPAPEKKQVAEEYLRRIQYQLAPGEKPGTVKFHKRAVKAIRNNRNKDDAISRVGGAVVANLIEMAEQSPSKARLIYIDHLVNLDNGDGYHLQLPHSTVQVTRIGINPKTKVQYAIVGGAEEGDEWKESTLFPEGTSVKEMFSLIKNSTKIAHLGSRELRMTDAGYAIECRAKSALQYATIFPLFFYEKFEPDQEYALTSDITVSAAEVLEKAGAAKKIQYEIVNENNEKEVIVDVGPGFADKTGISKGILFKFSATQLAS